jgi:hypothetical protein
VILFSELITGRWKKVMQGLKEILLGPAQLYEALKERSGAAGIS